MTETRRQEIEKCMDTYNNMTPEERLVKRDVSEESMTIGRALVYGMRMMDDEYQKPLYTPEELEKLTQMLIQLRNDGVIDPHTI